MRIVRVDLCAHLEVGWIMKVSGWLVPVAAMAAFALQGCAQTGDVRADAVQAAVPAPTFAPAPAAAGQPAAVIPENDKGKPVIAADTKDHFEAVAAAVEQQMKPGGRWEFVSKEGRQTIGQRFIDMQALFDQYGSVDKMDNGARARLLDDQNVINQTLVRYDGNRLVCAEETPVGTHFPKKVCRTYGEIQSQQNDAQFMMRQNSKNHPTTSH